MAAPSRTSLLFRRKHALERGLHFFDRLVNDVVQLDVHAFALRNRTRVRTRPHVEADNDRAGGRREQHVGLVDRADAAVNHLDLHFVRRELAECVGQRLHRAVHVALDDQVQVRRLTLRQQLADVRQLHAAALDAQLLLALETVTRLRDFGRLDRIHHDAVCHPPAEHPAVPRICTGMPGPACLIVLAALVEQRTHAAIDNDRHTNESPTFSVPFVTSTVASAPLPTSSCASTTVPCAGRSGFALQIEHFRLQQYLLEQVVHADALLRADSPRPDLTAEVFDDHAVLQQVLLDAARHWRRADRPC